MTSFVPKNLPSIPNATFFKTKRYDWNMKYAIENDVLRLECLSLGGSLSSLFDKQKQEELLYQPEPGSWQGQDVAIFPFIARLKDKTYTHQGNVYSLRNHGLCRYYEFKLVSQEEDSLKLALESNEDTLKEFPFSFRFEITYRLEGRKATVTYEVKNLGKGPLPFGIGAHPAFKVDLDKNGDTSGNYVLFDNTVPLARLVFDKNGEFLVSETDFGFKDRIETKKEIFRAYKTLCLEGEGLHHITLLRRNGRKIQFFYDKIRYLVLWSFPDSGAFVAIEPWMSLPDYVDAPKEIFEKKGLLHLPPDKTYRREYQVTI